jgi:hypothetical protein
MESLKYVGKSSRKQMPKKVFFSGKTMFETKYKVWTLFTTMQSFCK